MFGIKDMNQPAAPIIQGKSIVFKIYNDFSYIKSSQILIYLIQQSNQLNAVYVFSWYLSMEQDLLHH